MNGSFYDFVLRPLEKWELSSLRQNLLSSAHGHVLEIGAGTGLNFSHYPADADVLATDPDESMLKAAKKRAPLTHIKIEVADAEKLPFPDSSFDTVVATLVFCTVPDPDKAMEEVYRVLKPGGTFLLLEHVRKNTRVAGKVLDTLTPAWKLVAGGCHLNRDPEPKISELGFQVLSKKILWKGLGKEWRLRKK